MKHKVGDKIKILKVKDDCQHLVTNGSLLNDIDNGVIFEVREVTGNSYRIYTPDERRFNITPRNYIISEAYDVVLLSDELFTI